MDAKKNNQNKIYLILHSNKSMKLMNKTTNKWKWSKTRKFRSLLF